MYEYIVTDLDKELFKEQVNKYLKKQNSTIPSKREDLYYWKTNKELVPLYIEDIDLWVFADLLNCRISITRKFATNDTKNDFVVIAYHYFKNIEGFIKNYGGLTAHYYKIHENKIIESPSRGLSNEFGFTTFEEMTTVVALPELKLDLVKEVYDSQGYRYKSKLTDFTQFLFIFIYNRVLELPL